MKKNRYKRLVIVVVGIILIFNIVMCKSNNKKMEPPVANKCPETIITHGHSRVDNYYWLKNREEDRVIAHLKAENEYTRAMMEDTEDLQESLYQEIVSRIKPTDESIPYLLNGFWYQVRYEEGNEYPIYSRKADNKGAKEQVLLDGNKMAEGFEYFDIGDVVVSENNNLLAYSIDTVSRMQYMVFVKDLTTGELLQDSIKNTDGSVVWASDNKTLFYTLKNESLRSYRVYRHVIGSNCADDVLVYEETDPSFSCSVFKSKSDKYIFIQSSSNNTDEHRYINASLPESEFKVFYPRERALEHDVMHCGDYFYIITNDQAVNFRIMRTPIDKTDKSNWEEVIAHRENVFIESMEVFKDFFVLEERIDGQTELRIVSFDGKIDDYIHFDEAVYTVYTGNNPQFDKDKLQFIYQSLIMPPRTLEYNLNDSSMTILKETKVLGGYDPKDYISARVFVPASDGEIIPVSIVYHKSFEDKRPMPLLLYAYGSYGISSDPWFSYSRVSLLDRGVGFAIAHVRGGQEKGRRWYEEGKMLRKNNTFTDFNDVAQCLIDKQITSPEMLIANGGSAGGLLMGVIANTKPYLYKGIIADVPFVDVVTTMLDEDIPLTTNEFDEWGNPKDKHYYDYMLSYSPYDNVMVQDYPAIFVITGFHDSQVQYWEPAKWVAKLRDLKTDENLLLLHTNMELGHGGPSGRFGYYREVVASYAFILNLLKIQ